MAGVGEFYYELRVARRGDAAADEATLRRVTFIKKLQERVHFFQDEGGTRIVLERVTQNEHAMGCAVGRLRNDGWNITFRASLPKTCNLLQAMAAHFAPSLKSQKSRDLKILKVPTS